MAYLYPLLLTLGAGNTGLVASIRYRVRDAASVDVIAATNSNVAELAAGSGNYWVTGGISIPDSFTLGYVEVSLDAGATWLVAAQVGPLDMPTPQQSAIATATAALVLATPAQKLVTDSAGRVTVGSIANNAITGAAIATDAIDADALKADAVAEIAAAILATPAQTLVTDAQGRVTVGAVANSALTAAALAADAVDEIADGVLDRSTAEPSAAGFFSWPITRRKLLLLLGVQQWNKADQTAARTRHYSTGGVVLASSLVDSDGTIQTREEYD